ncbi:LytR/AlgR family response regulator transcription factor [Abyssalbus ytuae]|uniref:Response regulator transcription factor n=1 Tax=Abyssalbus ytuae TaxID=2926907 RepID=A0A9E6ZI68_9FLAO|nr:response regulator transcription factor [Abyssalbus ytuae]UOB15962.1 response regulator transcription factor [Abyssalbus ytuae]
MKVQCLIIDDEPLARSLIEDYISTFSSLETVASCDNAINAFEILNTKKIDLIFLDIRMPVLDGMEFVKSLKNPPKVILTTAYRKYAPESYELNVIDYLLKPVSFERFMKAVDKYFESTKTLPAPASDFHNVGEEGYIYVNMNKKYHKILFNDIIYAESIKDYLKIHTPENSITTKRKIGDFEKGLPAFFLRTHKSYIINTKKITAFTATHIELDKIEIPIGQTFKQKVSGYLQQQFRR